MLGVKSVLGRLLKKIFLMFFFFNLFLRQRQRMRRGGADTESEAGSRLRAVSTERDAGLELTDHEITT